jgi:hypothetical protein
VTRLVTCRHSKGIDKFKMLSFLVILFRSVYYGQYKCSGPGSSEAGRVAWSRELTDWEAAPFLSLSFVDGEAWIPQYIRPLV